MRILIIDAEKVGLPFALQCQSAGHDVTLWMPLDKSGKPCLIGDGLVSKVKDWRSHITKADLIVLTDNSKYRDDLAPFFNRGFPIFGCNKRAGELELDREVGQDVLKASGIETLPYQIFSNYDDAIKLIRKTGKTYVSKPWGGDPDKSLSYVSRSPADMIFKLERWKKLGSIKGQFLLQEATKGVEMAVGGWFGPGGWSRWLNENWEEKRMMNEGLGVNTGEQGTVMRYVQRSKLFTDTLEPVTRVLQQLNYVGYVDMNCIVGEDGTPWPLEFTMRFGWPHFNLCMTLHEGDPANWMADLLQGRDTLRVKENEVCCGVVLSHGDYPYGNMGQDETAGFPIDGYKRFPSTLRLSSVMLADAPVMAHGAVKQASTVCTAGDYVAIATGTGDTVRDAQEAVYRQAWAITWPSNRMFRTDIGNRLKEGLPELQRHGYAKGMRF